MTINVAELLDYIKSKKEYLAYSYKLYDIFNKNLTPYVKERLSINFKSQTSREEAATRLAPINILPKLVNKLSKVYQHHDVEINTKYKTTLEEYKTKFSFSYRNDMNKFLNLFSCCALEPVFDEEASFVRVLAAHEFLVYSNSEINPNKVTHFIKIVKSGTQPDDQEYHIYSNDEFLAINGEGKVLQSLPNPYNTIPFTYIKRDTSELMPKVGKDDYEMVTLLPLLLTDMNFALKYKAYSIMYVLNAEAPDLNLAPNAIWSFNSIGQEGDKVEINQLTPTLAVDEVLQNISMLYTMWLETKNLKSPALSNKSQSIQALSGIAKIIDDADISDDIDAQADILQEAETNLLKKIAKVAVPSGFNWDFSDVQVSFMKKTLLPETQKDKVDRVIQKLENKLISWTDALSEIHSLEDETLAISLKEKIKSDFLEWNDVQTNDENKNKDA